MGEGVAGKQEQGLGKQAIKAAGQFPPAMERRGLQGHNRWLNIETLGGGSGSCHPQGAVQFLLMGQGTSVFVRLSPKCLAQPEAGSGTWRTSVWIWRQIFIYGWGHGLCYPLYYSNHYLLGSDSGLGLVIGALAQRSLLLGTDAFLGR